MELFPNIILHQTSTKLILFDIKKSIQYSLNGVGSFIFHLVLKKKSPEAIAQSVSKKYDVAYDLALRDINKLIRVLIKKNILNETKDK